MNMMIDLTVTLRSLTTVMYGLCGRHGLNGSIPISPRLMCVLYSVCVCGLLAAETTDHLKAFGLSGEWRKDSEPWCTS
ncbi:hypothetical protein J6590_000560 [Homalodisca vitripennis]|nr:hypothetical protein J6590_000560 [Homalodisca vitripennis]